jgi:hypothetical protein
MDYEKEIVFVISGGCFVFFVEFGTTGNITGI